MSLRIALTSGEPAGIGPDLAVLIAQNAFEAELVAVADPALLEARAQARGLGIELEAFDPGQPPQTHRPGRLSVVPVELVEPVTEGRLNPANARYVISTLDEAYRGCIGGLFDAMVTAPAHKGIINEAGIRFTGHTEYLATVAGVNQPVMMLSIPGLRVALATTHVPIALVDKLITAKRINQVVRVIDRDLRHRFGIPKPRILVCGLNPHAGESGHIGKQESEIISPTIEQLQTDNIDVRGPVPADSAFIPSVLSTCDVVLTMYHDQGLPVLKHRGFGHAVNITLGLPIIRTSVDHGTALELAGTGEVDDGSLYMAIRTAIDMARRATVHSQANAQDAGV